MDKLTSLSDKEVLRQAKAITDTLAQVEKGPPSQKRIQLLHYITCVASCRPLASALTQNGILGTMTKLVRESSHLDIRLKVARSLALVAHFTDNVDTSVNLSDSMSLLSEMLRENMKNIKLKQGLLPALGEIIALVAAQVSVCYCCGFLIIGDFLCLSRSWF